MRITGGRLGRRTIDGPPAKDDRVRPTTDRVREALFSILGSRMLLSDATVVDLFAGTGALGLEALSRGARHATFVDAHAPTLSLARKNARTLGVDAQCTFLRADALAFLSRAPLAPRPDLIFADPPYALDAIPELPPLARAHLAPEGLFVLEHDSRHDFADDPSLVLSRDYGSTRISVFEADA
ncbi:RsmD family RNA methyltransferase [Rubricoccus marinus]|uniref:16S rRNA (Guanine(966)-N(2))-methyltransferase RsmD n=1 Tax=Rubricoccus marinus TaxID=716817 RepID=A0A259TYQ2_9BACT|nr:RsmD family RNA methyltransferase [Rubricoccus marinus]OZC02872.1 hypothetical protein BSZ36_07745 [Rubricoccus marinus]